MTWHRSDLTAHRAGRALHYGHPGHIPRWTLMWSSTDARYILGGDARHVPIPAAELEAWCVRHRVEVPGADDVAWLRETPAR